MHPYTRAATVATRRLGMDANIIIQSRVSSSAAAAVCDAFRSRIGAERFGVWFGDAPRVTVERLVGGAVEVTIHVPVAVNLEWLHRMFKADFAAAAQTVCQAAVVTWVADVATGTIPPTPSSVSAGIEQGSAPAAVVSVDVGPTGSVAVGLVGPVGSGEAPPTRSLRRREGSGAHNAVSNGVSGGAVSGRRIPLTLVGFCVGPSNRMAHAAATLAADSPGAMSPLVIHGPGGVGKTHLLEGICLRLREQHPRAAAVMLSAEQFTTSFLEALHGRRGLPGFRRTLRGADLLAIDDIQFLIGKKATISELLHTLDALQRQGRQMVFTSDRDIESLAELGPDLQARLRGGMNARMLPPDDDVRGGIVEALAARRDLTVPADVVRFIATRMTRNTRELAGAVNRLEATSHMLGLPVTLGMAEECLVDLVRSSSRAVRLADIEKAICAAFGVDAGSLQSSCRARKVNHPRMLAMFLARKHTPAALSEIGAYFGRRSHSTVISAQRTVDAWLATGTRVVLADTAWSVDDAIRRVEEVLRAG